MQLIPEKLTYATEPRKGVNRLLYRSIDAIYFPRFRKEEKVIKDSIYSAPGINSYVYRARKVFLSFSFFLFDDK